jgi:hypothetical protein
VVESTWGNTESVDPTLKAKLYKEASVGSLKEIVKAQLLWAETDSHVSETLDALNQGIPTHHFLRTRSDQLQVATRILVASGRLSEHFCQSLSFNRMYP